MPYDVRFSAPYPYLLDKMQLCFYLSPISVLLPSKICAVKIQNIGKKMKTENSEQAPSKKEKYCENFSDSCCEKFKFIQKSWKDGYRFCFM